jgi:hypothetical protein
MSLLLLFTGARTSSGTNLTLGQSTWNWSPQSPALQFAIVLASRSWAWSAQALAQNVVLGRKAWAWSAQAIQSSQSSSVNEFIIKWRRRGRR